MDRASAKSGPIPPTPPSGAPGTAAARDAPFRIARDGTWFYLGSAIQRPEMVRLFVRALKREPHGPSPTGYALVTPYEHHAVIVDDVPFVANGLQVVGTGRSQRLVFTTNVGAELVAGRDHPIVMRAAKAAPAQGAGSVESGASRRGADAGVGTNGGGEEELRPYLMLDGGLEARIGRAVYYELAERAAPGPGASALGAGALGVWSDGAFFPLGPASDPSGEGPR